LKAGRKQRKVVPQTKKETSENTMMRRVVELRWDELKRTPERNCIMSSSIISAVTDTNLKA
jgi:hypothetical protein